MSSDLSTWIRPAGCSQLRRARARSGGRGRREMGPWNAGSEPGTEGGAMPLHPQAIEFLEYAVGQPKLHTLSPTEARAQLEGVPAVIGPGPRVHSVHDVALAVGDGEIAARVYR